MINYLKLIRFDKPIGSYLLLVPTFLALFLVTKGNPPLKLVIVFLLGVFIMRSAGCIINDIADRNIDKHVARTADRPLTSGKISLTGAIIFFIILIILAIMLLYFLNFKSVVVAFIAVILTIFYPFSKRFFQIPQLILSIAFSMPIVMVYTSLDIPLFNFSLWLLFFTNVFWTLSYDTMYALTDRSDDIKIGVKSAATFFAGKTAVYFIAICQLITIILFIILGLINNMSFYYYALLFVNLCIFTYQDVVVYFNENQGFTQFKNNIFNGLIFFIGLIIGLIH